MSRQITFPFAPTKHQQWDVWQKRLALAVVVSCLLSPQDERKQSRLRTALYIDLLSRFDKKGIPTSVRTFLLRRQIFRADELLELSRLKRYRARLNIGDRTRERHSTRYISSIVTVGLLVKVLAFRPDWKGERKITKAREYIEKHYRTAAIMQRNIDYQKGAWSKWHPVAHLSAALVDFLQQSPTLKMGDGEWLQLEDCIPSFLATALYYQKFLQREQVLDGIALSTKTANKIDLLQIPSLPLEPAFVTSALPKWDKNLSPR